MVRKKNNFLFNSRNDEHSKTPNRSGEKPGMNHNPSRGHMDDIKRNPYGVHHGNMTEEDEESKLDDEDNDEFEDIDGEDEYLFEANDKDLIDQNLQEGQLITDNDQNMY